ncbi:MAG: DUF6434 domain-containing protein [Pseudomonadota bacterium]
MTEDMRPDFSSDMTADEFERWYWPVSALKAACEVLRLPVIGSKADLRARVAFALRNPDRPLPKLTKAKPKSRFDWAKAELSFQTVITDNVSFGPNVRGFFKSEIGKAFVCHGDFMAWVKANVGATLHDAIEAWHVLEARKEDPTFRGEIASCNNYLQYLRDLRDHNPDLSLDEAKCCWDEKNLRPAQNGFVVYEASDLRFVKPSG